MLTVAGAAQADDGAEKTRSIPCFPFNHSANEAAPQHQRGKYRGQWSPQAFSGSKVKSAANTRLAGHFDATKAVWRAVDYFPDFANGGEHAWPKNTMPTRPKCLLG